MLATQINYWSYVENKRHNLENERQGRDSIKESIRHNTSTERIQQAQVDESVRHNKVWESQNQWMNTETKRHNLASEHIGSRQADAAYISAMASKSQAETARKNLTYTAQQAAAALKNAQSNYMNAATNRYNAETNRATGISKVWTDTSQRALNSAIAGSYPSNNFVNWTAGAKNITGSIKDIGSVVIGAYSGKGIR